MADRVTTHDGDFFSDELPEADLYAVGRILMTGTMRIGRAAALRLPAVAAWRAILIAKNSSMKMESVHRGQHAVVEYAGGHRRTGAPAERIRTPLAVGGGSAKSPETTGVALDAILAVRKE
ncbi:MAG: hypothetical protein WDO73_07915 [Ignavibacteriota bacterium]